MKIEYEDKEFTTLEEFADKHDLTLVVKEVQENLYVAGFKGCYYFCHDTHFYGDTTSTKLPKQLDDWQAYKKLSNVWA